MADVEHRVFRIETLHEFSTRVFLHLGVPRDDAMQAADVLASADLRGIDSHGVARLHNYFDMLSLGRINPKPAIKVLCSTLSTATVDGDNGLGLVVGPQANRIAMDMAEKAGSGWVSVRNTNHFGIAGYYVLEAMERDLIGWAMTNSSKMVAPLWGAERPPTEKLKWPDGGQKRSPTAGGSTGTELSPQTRMTSWPGEPSCRSALIANAEDIKATPWPSWWTF